MPTTLKLPNGIMVIAPDDATPEEMDQLANDALAPVPSHDAPSQHPHARVGQFVQENLPTLASAAATIAAPESLLLRPVVAGGAGYLGARARGDDRMAAAGEGAKQAVVEGVFGPLSAAVKWAGPKVMSATLPKAVRKEFGGTRLGKAMLDQNIFPGFARSAPQAKKLASEAASETEAAAAGVAPYTAQQTAVALRPDYQKAVRARKPEYADDILQYVKEATQEVGPTPMSGGEQLARKEVLQREGGSALRAQNPRMAAVHPQLANTERRNIVQNLRATPRMDRALDTQQNLVGIERGLEDANESGFASRFRQNPLTAPMSPAALGVTAHLINRVGAPALDPNVIRAAILALLSSQPQPGQQ